MTPWSGASPTRDSQALALGVSQWFAVSNACMYVICILHTCIYTYIYIIYIYIYNIYNISSYQTITTKIVINGEWVVLDTEIFVKSQNASALTV